MSKMTLNFSPLTGRVFLGRVNPKTGVSIGEQRDVTSEFLQIMEMKFPVNTTQLISVNGENKYRVIVVDLDKSVVVDENVIQEGSNPGTITEQQVELVASAPVAAQQRFRHPQKSTQGWSIWQPAAISLDRPSWEIDSQGYEVEYRLLYESPQPAPNVAGLVEALEWYSEHVLGCRKTTSEGEQYRTALDRDGGARARAALAAHHKGAEAMNQLFSDLKTDEEKAEFFLSGRGYGSGVIAHSIQNDVAMAYHRCSEYCKETEALQAENERLRKDVEALVEALRLILGWRELRSGNDFPIERIEEIARAALATHRKQEVSNGTA